MDRTRSRFFLLSVFLFLLAPVAMGAETESKIEKPVRQAIDTRQATQKAQEKWRDDREKLKVAYERLEMENNRLEEQVGALKHRVKTTQQRILAKKKQLADIEQIASQIDPFVRDVIAELKVVLAMSDPFLTGERTKRIEKLERLVEDPEVPISEQYRKVMEALLIEAEYGTTIETYQKTITVDRQPLLADIFRLGRISLFYLSLDRAHCGFYNVATSEWEALAQRYRLPIRSAIDIAAKRKPVELLTLPVGRLAAQ